ncbi:MAG: SPFH domain-containing protein, partial [Alistipes sp.]|nr:SPFH domain-containing protein [Alistipes sp.]
MENKNYTYNGWKCNGLVALILNFVALGLAIWSIIEGGMRLDAGLPHGVPFLVGGLVAALIALICFGGYMLLEPNEARVMLFFGEYRGTFYENGYWWVNPFLTAKKISVRARNLNVDPIKVN